MKSGIYKIVNKINGKIYVGSAINIEQRWWKHISTANNKIHHNLHFQSAWNKYGKDNFEFIVLEYCEVERLEERENYWIKLTNCNEIGYNKRKDAVSNRGFKHTKESKRKSSISNTGLKRSEETRQKIKNRVITDEWRKNCSKSAMGRKHSEITKAKVTEALKIRVRSKETYEKIGIKNRGQKRTEEQRKRMSEGRWNNKSVIFKEPLNV